MRAAVVVIVLGVVAACTKPNPNRCCTDQADCNAAGIPVGTSCGSGLVCRGDQCIAEVCTSASDCDLSSPFCVDSSCSSTCTADDQCPGNGGDPAKVHCEAGACVACRAAGSDCPTTAPVCDMGGCRGCAADSECASAACDRDSGSCVVETTVVYASPNGTASSSCTKTDPCSLAHALTVVDASRPNIKLEPGTYSAGVAFSGSFTLTVYGPASVASASLGGNGGTLRLRNIDAVSGVSCSAATSNGTRPKLDLKQVTAEPDYSLGDGLDLANCDGTVTDMSIKGTYSNNAFGAAVYVAGSGGSGGSTVTFTSVLINGGDPGLQLTEASTASIVNSVFSNQLTTFGALYVSSASHATFDFSTFYNSILKCQTTGGVLATFSNSIFLNNASGAPANTVTGTTCSHSYDLIKPQATAVGSTNLLNMDPRFVNAATGDFHLMMGSPAIDAADPASTEATDYDGTARPQGTARDIGAFEYKP